MELQHLGLTTRAIAISKGPNRLMLGVPASESGLRVCYFTRCSSDSRRALTEAVGALRNDLTG